MTSVDFFAVKEKIVAILKSDTTNLWWSNNAPANNTKFRNIQAGSPLPLGIQESPLPRLWVTDDDIIANIKNFGAVQSNTPKGTTYDINLKIVFVDEAKDGPTTENKLDDFQKAIIEKLQGNIDLRTPAGAESTQLALNTKITQIQKLKEFEGDGVLGRVIRMTVTEIA